MIKWKAIAAVGALLICANLASATVVTYDAVIRLDWSNGYVGNRTTTENNATVTVNYTGGGAFEITALTFSEPVTGLGTMNLGESGTSAGTISGGIATGTVGYAGTIAGSYNLLNVGGQYQGTVANGSSFHAGDVYSLLDFHAGTVNPAIGGKGDWNHRAGTGGGSTYIQFGVPEPATMLLLVGGLALLRRR